LILPADTPAAAPPTPPLLPGKAGGCDTPPADARRLVCLCHVCVAARRRGRRVCLRRRRRACAH